MIRKAASKFLILAAVTLATGAVAVNCSKKSDKEDIGSVGLALVLPGGGIVNTVHYTITGNGIAQIDGDIDVSAPGTTTATALVSGLPEGTYTVSMTAMGTMPTQSCTGSNTFTVVRNQTAMASVILQCTRMNNRGSVAINGRLDQCPLIEGVSASSLQGVVGGPAIIIGVSASELDPGDVVTYNWTASPTGVGTIGAQAASSTFACTMVGSTQLSIAVSDGVCGDSVMNAIPITCIAGTTTGTAGTGGSGTAGTGGSVGTAGTGGTVGTAGAGGSGTAGTGGSGTAGTGGSGTAGTGGSGTGGTGGSGTGGTGGSAVNFAICPWETNPPAAIADACQACLDANKNPAIDGCCGITGDQTGIDLCQAASACMRAGGPPVGVCNVGGDVTTCYCGNNLSTCGTGGANGPCVAQVTAAAGRNVTTHTTDAPTPATILSRQGDPNYALGRAANIQVTAAAFCPADCGF